MQVKTSELTGAALDWAVAICEEINIAKRLEIKRKPDTVSGFNPSTDWSQGGPIIEREGITLNKVNTHSVWVANIRISKQQQGKTPLIAAMRCYVASKLGDTVEIPDELA